jgi:hypothetical protein
MMQIGNGGTPPSSRVETPVELWFQRGTAAPTTVATAPSIGDFDLVVASATNFAIGSYVGVFCPSANRFFFAEVLAISVNTLTFDTPIDFAFLVGDNVQPLTREINTNGATIPVTYQIQGAGPTSGLAINITRFMFSMECSSAVDLHKFGNITDGLARGLVLQRANGITRNIFNAKTNSDLVSLAYDVTFYDATQPVQGIHGLSCRYTFSGEDKHGTVLQLLPGDSLDLLVQDDLSTLVKFRILGQGYETRVCCTPSVIDIPAGNTMTPVATNVTTGYVHAMTQSVKYVQFYTATGDTAPTDKSEAVAFDDGIEIRSSTGIDVYVGVASGTPGKVRIDL